MNYRFYQVTAIVAVANYEDEVCEEHAELGSRTASDALSLINTDEDFLIVVHEEELHLQPKPRMMVRDEGQGPRLPKLNNKGHIK